MPDTDLPIFLRRLQNVAERIRDQAQRAVTAANPSGELKLIASDAEYLLADIEDQQSPVTDRWKCTACGKVTVVQKAVRRRALSNCRCGRHVYEPHY